MKTYEYISFISKIREKLQEAGEKYGIENFEDNVEIRFDLRGVVAGKALYKRSTGESILWFNADAYDKEPIDMINNTIPHEIAHLVAAITGLGKGHDKGWARICESLGGESKRCHSYNLEKARKFRQFLYVLDSGREVKVKTVMHNRIQSGQTRIMVDTNESFGAKHFVREIRH